MPQFRRASLGPAVFLVVLVPQLAPAQSRDPFQARRHAMVDEHIAAEGVTNPRVLQAMKDVPRHLFVRPALREFAYYDQALDIGEKQTISPPFIVAYMTEVIDPQPEDRVLEIGTGSGYQAAVLSGLVNEVYTIEIIPALGRNAERLLNKQGYRNVHVRIGDGYEGWPEHAPFDKIIVTCSPENVPQPLVDQLKDGGRMIVPLGERYQQVFHLLEKQAGKMVETRLLPTLFVPMTGESEERRQVQPDPAHPRIVNGGFEQTREDGLAVGWHYQRRTTLLEDKPPEGARYICFENTDPGRGAHILQGLALDGSVVTSLTVSLTIKVDQVRPGKATGEEPALVLHFFDHRRVPIGQKVIGPWLAESDVWQKVSQHVSVPSSTREAILQVGLNGATGRLCLDNIVLAPQRR
jgi:protein-L-isoaspartate(D-aspartate) O-methyltransferase